MHGIERGEAGIFRVDEDEAVVTVDGNLVNVEVPGGVGGARHIEPVELLVRDLAALEHVVEAPHCAMAETYIRRAPAQSPMARTKLL